MGVLAVAGTLLVLLVAAQLVLPKVAAHLLRGRLAGEAVVARVHVSAFPAVKLLWGQADRVDVHLTSLRVSQARVGALLAQAKDARTADVTIDRFQDGVLRLRALRLHEDHGALRASAYLAATDLQRALPPGFAVSPVASGGGQLVLRATAFGLGVDAVVAAVDGALVAQPNLPLVGSLAGLTLFSDPRVSVSGVGATTRTGGYGLTAAGRLEG
ncbi:hypothetical protein NBH00_08745 [Paraconexibacter antarcticus]|uniref:DUF2993 domain-containing protein n=1 Tax=Paraconexibacter antarcticus TaxID=2949664 RepID=A0ABY5E0E0_9ACTN|nr:hypothetical protein [Paraconexibacter antarcticus]UTI66279.1 hypothetical protein NBH00_08745 [Paraconexibacter antarcticus]